MNRNLEFDILKGVLMILVVLGHSGFQGSNIIYWFHMPLFFMISGYFFKIPVSNVDLKDKIKKVTVEVMTPYFVYLLLLNLFFLNAALQVSTNHFIFQSIKLLYGGRYLFLTNGTFWFVTVLLLTRIVFTLLAYYFSLRSLTILVIFSCILATLESFILHHSNASINFPFNCDVVLFALPFYYLGYLFKLKNVTINAKIFTISIVSISVLIYLHFQKLFYFEIDMKYTVYYQAFLNVLVPLLFATALYVMCIAFKNIPYLNDFLSYIGRNSIIIMYLHIFINTMLFKLLGIHQNIFLFVIFGLSIPLGLNFFIQKKEFTRKLLIGK